MTIIKYFDTPHIIRFGMTNHDPGKSEMQLWRNGVKFIIEIDQANVKGTDFERQWLPLLDPEPLFLHAQRWNELCGLVISQCMDTLQELAPNKPYWTNLYEYFHVASYVLRLHGAPESKATSPQVVVVREPGSPTITCAYEMQPAAWCTFAVPDDLPVFDSRAVIPVDHEHNFKRPPHKVRLPDGKLAFFLACTVTWQQRHQDGSSSESMNESHQSIASYLRLHGLKIPRNGSYARIPKVLGVVSDSSDPQHAITNMQGGERERQMAGILLEWIDGFRLINLASQNSICHIDESNHAEWSEQLNAIIRELHRRGVSSLGVDISPFDVIIDRDGGHAWLTGFVDVKFSSDDHDDNRSAADVDELERKQMQLVFDRWLSEETGVSRSSEDPEEFRKGAVSRWFAISDDGLL
ncbi:hypothetical protein L228DRAFT_282397 [Xylona heveae TC161]|uniref:Uncharacterized protein n=1 Tax=Xylona heveae (strain CBS 132557 / TC161) TaxID=1328760 RepID=A0A165HLL5_XYLHT|nr:hypothetical protein L228DRAFT_282397 [Xylona heveae TC161]KZF23701.1 hypothetical protein L228DRAFT_282397 [Xylona heveae TC161]